MTGQRPLLSIVIPSYNAGVQTVATAREHLRVASANALDAEVVVVDDGSRPDERRALASLEGSRTRIITTPKNLGRGGAVNAGGAVARGRWLLVVDADCPPAADDYLVQHLLALESGADVSIGGLLKRRDDFWGRYQDDAVARRERLFAEGLACAFTSQNVMLGAAWFANVDGFDARYARYGFEDRDFLIRLHDAGARISYSPRAAVIHDDENIRMPSIVEKTRVSGMSSAGQFASRHPRAYRELGYASIDAELRPWLAIPARLIGPVVPILARWAEPALQQRRVPFAMRRAVAKVLAALAFLHGTSQRTR